MALKSTITGEYHKILIDEHRLDLDIVTIQIYENETHRQEVKNNNEEELTFKKSYRSNVYCNDKSIIQILIEASWDAQKDTKDNYKTCLYNYLKTREEYINFINA